MSKLQTPKSNILMPGSSATNGPVLASSVLPPWSAAVPFWLGSDWLWLALDATGARFWRGSGDSIGIFGRIADPQQIAAQGTFQVIVLDCRAVRRPDSAWWRGLAAMLNTGGLLLMCYRVPRSDSRAARRCPRPCARRPARFRAASGRHLVAAAGHPSYAAFSIAARPALQQARLACLAW